MRHEITVGTGVVGPSPCPGRAGIVSVVRRLGDALSRLIAVGARAVDRGRREAASRHRDARRHVLCSGGELRGRSGKDWNIGACVVAEDVADTLGLHVFGRPVGDAIDVRCGLRRWRPGRRLTDRWDGQCDKGENEDERFHPPFPPGADGCKLDVSTHGGEHVKSPLVWPA